MDRLPQFSVKCRPRGKPGNVNISKNFRLLIGPDLVTRPEPLLLLLLSIILVMILHNGNQYLHTTEFPAFKFQIFVIRILQSFRK